MKKYIYIILSLLLTLASCYEDKGNYEYSDIKELTIDFPNYKSVINFGDTLRIKPTFSFDIPEDAPYMTYRWSISGETKEGWDKRNLEWIADTVMIYSDFSFEATDNRTGLVFSNSRRLAVNSLFDTDGWVILSEVDGNSVISFVKQEEEDDETGYISKLKVFKDAYPSNNNQAVLGKNPISFHEHFSEEFGTIGQFVIFQDEAVDIDGLSFKKVLNMSQTFDEGELPGKMVNGSFMSHADLLQDDKGKLYSRVKSTKKLFHSNYFLSDPLKFEGEELKGCKIINGRYKDSKATLVHDTNKQRFLYIFDGDNLDWNNPMLGAGYITAMPGAPTSGTLPEKYFPLDNTSTYDIINMTYCIDDYIWGYKMVVKEKLTGIYYYQEFYIDKLYASVDFTLIDMKVYELPGLNFDPEVICCQTYSESGYLFLTQGAKIYMFNTEYPNAPVELYIDLDKNGSGNVKITSMASDSYRNVRMVAGLDNGDFCILRVEGAKNFTTDAQKLEVRLEQKEYLGKIVKVYPKIGDFSSWI